MICMRHAFKHSSLRTVFEKHNFFFQSSSDFLFQVSEFGGRYLFSLTFSYDN